MRGEIQRAGGLCRNDEAPAEARGDRRISPRSGSGAQGRKGEHRTLRVGKKTFGYYCFDHHGDGRVALWCKATLGEQGRLVAENPRRFFVPPYVGPSGWVGVRLDQRSVEWAEIAYLLRTAYRLSAPKKLAARLE